MSAPLGAGAPFAQWEMPKLKSGLCKYAAYTAIAAVLTAPQAAAEHISTRIERSVAVLDKLDGSAGQCFRRADFARVECAVIIPGFYRGAAVAGEVFEGGLLLEASFGRGFISCRHGNGWSAPGAVAMGGGSRTVQIGENIDVVILSMKISRGSPLHHHSIVDMSALATLDKGGFRPADHEIKILILDGNRKIRDGIELAGAVLYPDDSTNKALLGGGLPTSAPAQALISKLSAFFRE